jgi:hypothetical protein
VELMTEEKVFRSNSTPSIAAVFIFFAIGIFAEGVGALSGGTDQSTSHLIVGVVVIFVAVLLAWWAVFYFARMGVTSTNEGIIIRNWFRKKFVAWPDLEVFKFGTEIANLTVRESLSSPYLQTYAITKDGHHFVMCGITATRVIRSRSRRKVQEILDLLEDEKLSHNRES